MGLPVEFNVLENYRVDGHVLLGKKRSLVKAYLSGEGQICGSGDHSIHLNAVTIDQRGEFDTTAHCFEAHQGGTYLVMGQVVWDNAPADTVLWNYFTPVADSHSTPYVTVPYAVPTVMAAAVRFSTMVSLNAGDKIYLTIYNTTGTDQTILSGEKNTFLIVVRVA